MAVGLAKPLRAPAAPGGGPGHAWYLVAVLIVLAGWGAMAATLYLRRNATVDRMVRVVVPGDAELTLAGGSYTIFHEYRSVVAGRSYSVTGVSGLLVDLRERPGGAEIALESAPRLSYSQGDKSGRSLFEFEVRESGIYLLATSYSAGRREPQTVLAIARDYVNDRATTMRLAMLFGFGSLALAAAFALAIFARQRMARLPPKPD